ncbi:MAG TPA: DUF2029 domain-containing protein [Deltaproteobacteria bacterium]|nr:DUF2029 domain-containing protein [Deltaproteobacteria bacterium]
MSTSSTGSFTAALLACGAAVLLLCAAPLFIADGDASVAGVLPYALAFAPYLHLLSRLARPGGAAGRGEEKALHLRLIVLFALLMTAVSVLAPAVLEDDMYRYVWDGRVLASGVNPYAHAPDSFALRALRDEAVYPNINYPYVPTIYPPAAQLVFAAVYKAAGSGLTAFKAVFAAFHLATVPVVVRLLDRLAMDRRLVVAYAWNPLVLKEAAGSGHVDTLAVFLLTASLLLLIEGRALRAAVLYGLAVGAKLFALALLPLYVKRTGLRGTAAAGATLALLYLPFTATAPAVLSPFEGLITYFEHWLFNPGPFDAVRLALTPFAADPYVAARLVCAASVLALSLYAAVRDDGRKATLVRGFFHVVAALVLLSPVVAPWYMLWFAPLLSLRPSRAWTALTALALLSYVFTARGADLPALRLLEFGIFAALLAGEGGFRRKGGLREGTG